MELLEIVWKTCQVHILQNGGFIVIYYGRIRKKITLNKVKRTNNITTGPNGFQQLELERYWHTQPWQVHTFFHGESPWKMMALGGESLSHFDFHVLRKEIREQTTKC